MILSLLAAAFTFTATATGVEKGTPVEFLFVCKGSDRDYEAMFEVEGNVLDFCRGLEAAGIPKGSPIDASRCRLWPVGCPLKLQPALSDFIETKMPVDLPLGEIIYTGAQSTNMPLSVFSLYTFPDSPILFNGIYEQGVVYNCHLAKETLKKGEKRVFKLEWDGQTRPQKLNVTAKSGNAVDILKSIRAASEKGEVDVQVDFSGDLSVAEATALSRALGELDSVKIKVNGRRDGGLFYRAFLPLVKWLDRKERLAQPFELTLGQTVEQDELVFIEEDWKVEGLDPKLTPRTIPIAEAAKHAQVDTCLIFARKETQVSRIEASMAKFKDTKIKNWYVFVRE